MSHCHGTRAKDHDIYLSFLVSSMVLFECPIVLNSFTALGDASLFCCIFGIHDYERHLWPYDSPLTKDMT